MSDQTVHLGRNIKRIREMLHIKQETVASVLGDDWTQQRVSLLEGKEDVETKVLDQIAKALKVTPEAIKNFSEEAAINIFANTFHDQAVNMNYQCTINPLERYIQAVEKNEQLYSALLKEKDEKIQLLERLVAELKREK